MRPEYMTPLTNARSQFFLATHVCLLENANSCGQNTSPPWFLVKSSIASSWTSMSQHLPTSISHTKLEIATYIHELADKLLPSTTSQYILLGTTQLAPNTTLHYKACKNYFPVLLPQNLHKVLPQYLCTRRQSDKKTILKHFLKGILKGKLLTPKLGKSADKSLSQPWCSHSNTIYDIQLQKTIVLRMQPLHQATLTQPLQCDLQRLSCKTQ